MSEVVCGLHHVAILTANIEKTRDRWVELFGAAPGEVRMLDIPGTRLRTIMLAVGSGTYVQLIEPHLGAGVLELTRGGEGTIYEVALRASPIDRAVSHLVSLGLSTVGIDGQPLPSVFATAMSGAKYAYLEPGSVGGTRVELLDPAT